MRHVLAGAALAAITCASVPASAEVKVTMSNGDVSLSAQNATISQILAEWARVGGTRIINGERVPGGPVTIELSHVPEAQALDILLRNAGGYLLAPRPVPNPTASKYDRILIVPVSSPARAAAPAVAPNPSFPAMRPAPVMVPEMDGGPGLAGQPNPGPPRAQGTFVPNPSFQPAQPRGPEPQTPPAAAPPAAPPGPSPTFGTQGVRVPGMVPPAPAPSPPSPTPVPDTH